ncbi:MAG: hypothetical protein K0Q97_57 [Bacillota bacterium]|nr:hypothetical protein [Bacillota bacterium]
MNFFQKFMIGRYGTDKLSMTLLVGGMIVTFIGDIVHSEILILSSYIFFTASFFRILSKNISARQQENIKFLKYYNPTTAWVKSQINVLKGNKSYKYFSCPNCKQKMRAPRKKGSIMVTCNKCSNKFNITT